MDEIVVAGTTLVGQTAPFELATDYKFKRTTSARRRRCVHFIYSDAEPAYGTAGDKTCLFQLDDEGANGLAAPGAIAIHPGKY